jgi:lambda repressor-like predicted transcriptional regulator
MFRMTAPEAIRARDDWPDIQQLYNTGTSLRSLATDLGIHHQQLKRALEYKIKEKEADKQIKTIRARAAAIEATVEEAEDDSDVGQALPVVRRAVRDINAETILADMMIDQTELRIIAEEHQAERPMVAIAARNASLTASAAILKAAAAHRAMGHSRALSEHAEFPALITAITAALEPWPEAAEAVAAAIGAMR